MKGHPVALAAIDGKAYILEDMTTEQRTMTNHCFDLDRKIDSAKFNLDQLLIGKQAFMDMLKKSLSEAPPAETVEPLEIK